MSLSAAKESEAYVTLQEASGIKRGDKVKVLRTAKTHELGWGNSWISPEMDKQVGKTLTVTNIREDSGVDLAGTSYGFPFFVLEKVAESKDVVVTCEGKKTTISRESAKSMNLIN